jgi:heme/copper-type cytochrome/quinol oxidase subunit 3
MSSGAATAVRPVPKLAPRPSPRHQQVLLTGTLFAAGASVMVFAGLIGIYLSQRAQALANDTAWLPEGVVLPLTPANVAIATLLMSCVTVQWAVWAIDNDDRNSAYVALGLTMLLGLAFVNETSILYQRMELVLADSVSATLIYTITGLHMAMVVGAAVYLGVMAFRALGGHFSSGDSSGVQAAAIYWHASVAVFAVIWYAIYITK